MKGTAVLRLGHFRERLLAHHGTYTSHKQKCFIVEPAWLLRAAQKLKLVRVRTCPCATCGLGCFFKRRVRIVLNAEEFLSRFRDKCRCVRG